MADKTIKLTITSPAIITFTRAGQPVAFDVSTVKELPNILYLLFRNGVVQKVGDAAAAAKKDAKTAYDAENGDGAFDELAEDERDAHVADAGLAAMNAVMESLAADEWGRIREGSDSDPLDRFRAGIVRGLFRKVPANGTAATSYKRRLGGKSLDLPYVIELLEKPADYEPTDGDVNKARMIHLFNLVASGELVDSNGKTVTEAAVTAGAERAKAADDAKKAAELAVIESLGDLDV